MRKLGKGENDGALNRNLHLTLGKRLVGLGQMMFHVLQDLVLSTAIAQALLSLIQK